MGSSGKASALPAQGCPTSSWTRLGASRYAAPARSASSAPMSRMPSIRPRCPRTSTSSQSSSAPRDNYSRGLVFGASTAPTTQG
eukprot:15452850-Alexandrium_andersonii.AAC.1